MTQRNNKSSNYMLNKFKPGLVAISAVILVLLVLASTVPVGVLAQDEETNEPNDSPGEATPITGTSIEGGLYESGGEDWYSFQATEGETASVLLNKSDNVDTLDFEIYGPDGSRITDSLSHEGDTREQLTFTPDQTDTYYVQISHMSNPELPMLYTLRLSGHTPTKTSTPTETNAEPVTLTESPNNNSSTTTDSSTEKETTSTSGPGFTGMLAFVALLTVAVFSIWRR